MPDRPEAWLPLPIVLFDTGAAPAQPTPVVGRAVGEEVQASPRCTGDRVHTIISMYEDEIRRVAATAPGTV
jgi:hypothetical protein